MDAAEYGFGLSYSTFTYNSIWADETFVEDTLAIQTTAERFVGQKDGESLYDILVTVHAEVENTGDAFGCEVAQLVSLHTTCEMTFERLKSYLSSRHVVRRIPCQRRAAPPKHARIRQAQTSRIR